MLIMWTYIERNGNITNGLWCTGDYYYLWLIIMDTTISLNDVSSDDKEYYLVILFN